MRSEGASSRGEQPPTGRIDRLVLRKETSSLPAHEAPCPVSPNTPARLALPARPAPVRGPRRPSALTSLPRSRSAHRASCRTVPPALVRGTSPVCILKPCSGRRFCGPLPSPSPQAQRRPTFPQTCLAPYLPRRFGSDSRRRHTRPTACSCSFEFPRKGSTHSRSARIPTKWIHMYSNPGDEEKEQQEEKVN